MNPRVTVAAVLCAVAGAACGGSPRLPPAESVTIVTLPPPTHVATSPPTTTATGPGATAPTETTTAPVTEPWQNVTGSLAGLQSECGNLAAMSVRPTGDTVIANVALHGLFASVDGSPDWAPMGTGAGSDSVPFRMTSVVYDPAEPNRFWVTGIYHGSGVVRTDDGGDTFVALGNVPPSDLVGVDFTDPFRRTLLAGSHESPALSLSTDGGQSWRDVSSGLPTTIGFAASPVVIDAQTFLIGTSSGAESGVFRSTDQGTTWTRVLEGAVVGAPVVDAAGSITWLRQGGAGLVRSDDGGLTWSDVGGLGWIDDATTSLVAMPDGRLATLADGVVAVSADGGATWTAVGDDLPFVPFGLVYSAPRSTFYIWHFTCPNDPVVPVLEDAIAAMRVDAATLPS